MIEFKDIKWYSYHGALLPRTAPHQEVFLTKSESRKLLKKSGTYFLRYTDEWDRGSGEFWYVIKDEKEGLDSYKSKIRNQIKRGLKNCIVEKVDKTIIANNGYDVYIEAFKNYSTFIIPISKENFKKSILSSSDDFWAVYDKNRRLIAYANNFIENNMCHYNSMKFHPESLNLYPSYALIYTMNEYYLNHKKYRYVSDGARSISHETNIQNFLIKKFNFRKAYCRLNIDYRLDVKILTSIFFPFRQFIRHLNVAQLKRIDVLLHQEEIRRSYE